MIKLIPNPTFEQTVKLTVPDLLEPVEVFMTFKYMTAAACAEWFKSSNDKPVAEAIAEIITGWSCVMNEEGKAAEYSKETLQQLLMAYQPAALEIVRAWQQGLTESRVKN
jgi:hypothetical protein